MNTGPTANKNSYVSLTNFTLSNVYNYNNINNQKPIKKTGKTNDVSYVIKQKQLFAMKK